jgi:hypothetical protein
MMRKFTAVLITAALILSIGSAAAVADRRQPPPERGRDARHTHPQRPVNDVINEVERRYGGKVVGVQQGVQNEQMMYRVRVLQRDGRVKTLHVPANGRR